MFEIILRICGALIATANIVTLCMYAKTQKCGVVFALTAVFLWMLGIGFAMAYAINGAV